MTAARVAVVGAGWAGLSAAVYLAARGHRVTVFEASRQCGGRARRVDWNLPSGTQIALDNGQHILLGAYRDTLSLIHTLGIEPEAVFLRMPLTLCSPSGLEIRSMPLFGPLHLLTGLIRARGLSLSEKGAILGLMAYARRIHWHIDADVPLAQWMMDRAQPAELVHKIWAPLCVAALNTPITIASTQIFLNVLRDSLGAGRSSSDMLLPRVPLSAVLPEAAAAFIGNRGGQLRYGCRVTDVDAAHPGCSLTTNQGSPESFDAAILALPAYHVSALTRRLCGPENFAFAACDDFEWQPIATVFLLYAPTIHLMAPMLALDENPDTGDFGQWVFDRGQLGGPAGLLAVVISAHGAHEALDQDALGAAIAHQLARQIGIEQAPEAIRIITEKRATFASVPHLRRPVGATPWPWLALAGDYTQSDYPATLEAAVTSGHAAAQILIDHLAQ